MRSRWCAVLIGCGLLLACREAGLSVRSVTADVGRGALVVLVGGDQEQARSWLDAATPGYRFVHVEGDGDRGALRPGGRRVLIVTGQDQALGLALAERDPDEVAGVLVVDDGTPLSPAWQAALDAHRWPWRRIAATGDRMAARTWWQAWLPAKQAAFSVQPSPSPEGRMPLAPGP